MDSALREDLLFHLEIEAGEPCQESEDPEADDFDQRCDPEAMCGPCAARTLVERIKASGPRYTKDFRPPSGKPILFWVKRPGKGSPPFEQRGELLDVWDNAPLWFGEGETFPDSEVYAWQYEPEAPPLPEEAKR